MTVLALTATALLSLFRVSPQLIIGKFQVQVRILVHILKYILKCILKYTYTYHILDKLPAAGDKIPTQIGLS